MADILLLEDDVTLAESLIFLLEDEGYEVSWVRDGTAAIDATATTSFDLLLLDVNVPGTDGFTALRSLRDAAIDTPAIFITALQDIRSLSQGFQSGANDYLKKPFDFDELMIRIKALIRQYYQSIHETIEIGDLSFHIDRGELYKKSVFIPLSDYERRLVRLFFRHSGTTLTKEDILFETAHGEEASEGALRVRINKLRKIGLPIQTVKNVGYRLEIK
ncbi:response regulator transcription factor [Sulfurimonas sp. HSL-1656]|uniref:response regulator transcription factor n=1 Tax=Thiomicrolovo subterrani TaxID=3131934 RepID=UPI0031F93C13